MECRPFDVFARWLTSKPENDVMWFRVLLASLLAGAISPAALFACEPPRDAGRLRPLTALEDYCRKLLVRQTAIYNGTKALHRATAGTAGKKPRPVDRQAALRLSDSVKALIKETTKAIDLLEAEGSAVAFLEVFQALREDMKRVQQRLEMRNVGAATLAIEQDILDTLKEMITSLRKL